MARFVLAGAVLLLADLPFAQRGGWRYMQIVIGGGCIATGISVALGGS